MMAYLDGLLPRPEDEPHLFVLDRLTPLPERLRGAFVAVGNFDGVHRGHAALLSRLRALADRAAAPAFALTFDPHPVALLRPEAAHVPLTWIERTAELMESAGATDVGVFRTGKWLLELTAREFFDRVIVGQLGARGMVEGPTFGFGKDRAGDTQTLAKWCRDAGLEFEVAEPVEVDGGLVSSSRIRAALSAGTVELAARLLGRPHRIRGQVTTGAGRGAPMGFPTANLSSVDTQIPSDGVYAGVGHVGASSYPAAIHIGPNATFGATERSIEAHLLDFHGELASAVIEIDFLAYVRSTQQFENAEALRRQISLDVERTRALAANRDGG